MGLSVGHVWGFHLFSRRTKMSQGKLRNSALEALLTEQFLLSAVGVEKFGHLFLSLSLHTHFISMTFDYACLQPPPPVITNNFIAVGIRNKQMTKKVIRTSLIE